MNARSHFFRPLAILLIAGVCAANADTTAPALAPETKTPPPQVAKGPLAKLDLITHQLTLTLKDGPHTYLLDEKTYIFRGKQKTTADKLKLGETVALSYFTDTTGRLTIRRIKVAPEPPAPPPASPDKPPSQTPPAP